MLQKMNKIVLLWGPFFVRAPVRPNMLNVPKSASEHCDMERLPTLSHIGYMNFLKWSCFWPTM